MSTLRKTIDTCVQEMAVAQKQTNLLPVTILLIGNGSGRLVTVYRFVLNQELDWP